MAYDLVIRNGTVVDGSGLARYRADVAVNGDRIARIGRVNEKGSSEIDAEGHVVTPGFIDIHTHMDAQLFWDNLGSCSCWHGITSVVMGNCGFTLAPSRPGKHDLVLSNLERAEEIPKEALAEGVEWTWESFPEYLNAVEAQPKAINYAAQIGHSALRTFAMGERAFSEQASDEDLKLMKDTLREALRVGAIGFSTSRHKRHLTLDDRPVASRVASWDELSQLVAILGEEGSGIFQLDPETDLTESDDPEVARSFYARLGALSIATQVTMTHGIKRQNLQVQLDSFDATAAAGGRIFGQSRSEPIILVRSFKTTMPFDDLPGWKAFREQARERQLTTLRDPATQKQLVEAVGNAKAAKGAEALATLHIMTEGKPYQSLAALAQERRVPPAQLLVDLALDTNFEQAFLVFTGWTKDEDIVTMMSHPHAVLGNSDAGAHVSRHSGASVQTALFSDWVREREVFTLEQAVRMTTLAPALAWRLPGRGILRENMIADINVFDPDKIALTVPTIENDLPTGLPRVKQMATGFLSTVVSGKETFRNNEHTGAFPGRLVRSEHASRS